VTGHGKWSTPGVPHRGWTCVDVEDLGAPDGICQMCETQEIRFVHYMMHPDCQDVLGCGCICAGKMEEDYEGARQRETSLKNAAQRRKRWLSRAGWRTSAKGNDFINADGFNIVIFEKGSGTWCARIQRPLTGETHFSHKLYETPERAKLAAFDAMIFLAGIKPPAKKDS
jgi:hypothetical protein